jgi:hypothetical protein
MQVLGRIHSLHQVVNMGRDVTVNLHNAMRYQQPS